MQLEDWYKGYVIPEPWNSEGLIIAGRHFSTDESSWCAGWHCRSNCRECLFYPDDDPDRYNAFADWLLSHGVANTRPGYTRELHKNFKPETRRMGE